MSSPPTNENPAIDPFVPDRFLVREVVRTSQPKYTDFKYIAADTLIFSEKALAPIMPSWEQLKIDLYASLHPWLMDLIQLSQRDSESHEKVQNLPRHTNPQWYSMLEPQLNMPPEGDWKEALEILVANSWLVPMSEKAAELSHSCVGNVGCYWDETTQRVNVVAIRDVKEGEELATSQRIDYTMNREDRHAALHYKWGIDCDCDGCKVDPLSQVTSEGNDVVKDR